LSGTCDAGKATRIIARVGAHTAAKADTNQQLFFDPNHLHLFAPGDNGAAL
jgi:hypothetical protein